VSALTREVNGSTALGLQQRWASRALIAKDARSLEARSRFLGQPRRSGARRLAGRPIRYTGECTGTNYRRHAAASRCESPKCERENCSALGSEIPHSRCSRYESVTGVNADKLTPVYT